MPLSASRSELWRRIQHIRPLNPVTPIRSRDREGAVLLLEPAPAEDATRNAVPRDEGVPRGPGGPPHNVGTPR